MKFGAKEKCGSVEGAGGEDVAVCAEVEGGARREVSSGEGFSRSLRRVKGDGVSVEVGEKFGTRAGGVGEVRL